MLVTRYTRAPSPLDKNSEGKKNFLYARPYWEGREEDYGPYLWIIEVKKAQFCILGKKGLGLEDAKWVECSSIPERKKLMGNYCTFFPEDVLDYVLVGKQ